MLLVLPRSHWQPVHEAASPFDHGRILVAAPRDAPPFHARNKETCLRYLRELVCRVAERTRGRMLVLFTNANDCAATGRALVPWFSERGIPFWYQRMEGADKEELAELFRSRTDSVLFGLDTFWYGADFPGETLEYLVLVKLPYGVPDRYHHAQCAAIGPSEQRRQIYMPRALAKFRQGFGRLMRKETDRGCVFLVDGRVHDPRHRGFLRELPLAGTLEESGLESAGLARFVRGDTDRCLREALAHMGMLAEVERHEAYRERGEDDADADVCAEHPWAGQPSAEPTPTAEPPRARRAPEVFPMEIDEGDVPL